MTFQVNRGMQITKDRVYDVANPRTVPQMAQRLTFANASKFYKAAIQAFFKFAYEDKLANDTDYNAFMRLNASRACCASRKMLERNYPALGNYILTQGSLQSIDPQYVKQNTSGLFILPNVSMREDDPDDPILVGDIWREFLDAYTDLQNGDIITRVIIRAADMQPVGSLASAKENNALMGLVAEGGSTRPVWEIHQFVVDVNNTKKWEDADATNDCPFYWGYSTEGGEVSIGVDANADDKNIVAVAFIASRPLGGSDVKVSTATLVPSDDTAIAIAIGQGEEWKRYCAETYELAVSNLDADAILKGEIIAQTKVLTYETPSSSTVTTRTKVTTILTANNVSAENVQCVVTVGSENKTATFTSYIFAKDDGVNKRMAQYKTTDGNTVVQLPVDGTTVVAGNVYLQSTTAAKLVSINK